jgi:hypothetical protein
MPLSVAMSRDFLKAVVYSTVHENRIGKSNEQEKMNCPSIRLILMARISGGYRILKGYADWVVTDG